VYSNDYPDTIPPEHFIGRSKEIRGSEMVFHRRVLEGVFCRFVEGPCDWDSTALGADKLFRDHGVSQFEQSEAFWKALEGALDEENQG